MNTHPDLTMLLATELRSRLAAEAEHARLLTVARRARRGRRGHRQLAGSELTGRTR